MGAAEEAKDLRVRSEPHLLQGWTKRKAGVRLLYFRSILHTDQANRLVPIRTRMPGAPTPNLGLYQDVIVMAISRGAIYVTNHQETGSFPPTNSDVYQVVCGLSRPSCCCKHSRMQCSLIQVIIVGRTTSRSVLGCSRHQIWSKSTTFMSRILRAEHGIVHEA